jgi:transcriptional regulator with XRE-family HTH domain
MSHDSLYSLGQEVARLRRARALTQEALSARSGIARGTIAKLEVGKLDELGVGKLLALLNAMDCALQVTDASAGVTLDDLRLERGGAP